MCVDAALVLRWANGGFLVFFCSSVKKKMETPTTNTVSLTPEEVARNPRARSSALHLLEKVPRRCDTAGPGGRGADAARAGAMATPDGFGAPRCSTCQEGCLALTAGCWGGWGGRAKGCGNKKEDWCRLAF